ncbi:MAG TPA: cytochrome c [Polyangia bacterium]|nr:cytochrome c [Polyangia bacterium]
MRRVGWSLVVSGLLAFSAACGSSGSSKPDGGGGTTGSGGTGGSTSPTGGTGGSATGGSGGTGGSATGGTGGSATGGSGGGSGGSGGSGGAGGSAGAGGSGGSGGAGGASGGSGGAHTDGGVDADATTDGGDGGLTSLEARGQYLANSVLGCAGCHTPRTTGAAAFSGVDCFVSTTVDGGTSCLSSANLTNDVSGIKNLTDQQVKDAFTKGVFPQTTDAGVKYLFANMPYYQFGTLTDDDASAIVAYLRSLPATAHTVTAASGDFATRPTAAQWTTVPLASYPVASAPDGGADASADAGAAVASAANGKYLAALVCSTCHTVNASVDGGATNPIELDATKLFHGGKEFTTTVTVAVDGGADGGADAGADGGTTTISKKIQSANLTPDTTGLKDWTPAQIVTAIKAGKDEGGRSICSPMRPFPGMTDSDANDIAAYLKAIPAAANALTETCE